MKKIYLTLVLTSLVYLAQAQLKKFSIEVPYAPKFIISDSIQSFTILNRSLTPEFVNYHEDSLQVSFYKQNFAVDKTILDSLVSDSTIKLLGELLFNSERFDIVIPVERNIQRLLPFTQTPEPLSWNYVESICAQFETDALIVLENIALRTVTNYQSQIEWMNFSYEKTYFASIDFYSRSHWRIYYPASKQIIVDYKMTEDTLYWEGYEYDLKTTFRKLPPVKTAAFQTGAFIANSFSSLITPQWVEETRYYYALGDQAIDESIVLASEGNWQGALDNWESHSTVGNANKRSRILFNLALAYEMTGNLDAAIEKAKESQSIYNRDITNNYLKQLVKRNSSK